MLLNMCCLFVNGIQIRIVFFFLSHEFQVNFIECTVSVCCRVAVQRLQHSNKSIEISINKQVQNAIVLKHLLFMY